MTTYSTTWCSLCEGTHNNLPSFGEGDDEHVVCPTTKEPVIFRDVMKTWHPDQEDNRVSIA